MMPVNFASHLPTSGFQSLVARVLAKDSCQNGGRHPDSTGLPMGISGFFIKNRSVNVLKLLDRESQSHTPSFTPW